MQNKPNFKMGKMNIRAATVKAYAKEQRTMNNERYSKQTQTNPIPPHRESIENRVSSIKYPALFMQNKPNFKMGNINISTAIIKA